ncbi:MAG TPA: glycosyltransferase family 39 protein [Patescibacteria group bacterium]|nr:glycosyltransferase family 39 protein [Patescibacteria group bacterium]
MRFKAEKLLLFLVVTRIFILILPWLTVNLLFPENTPLSLADFTITSWNRWDAPHYLYIAEHWYTSLGDESNFIVFFPLYPLILKPFIFLMGNAAVAGVFLSTILFLIAGYFFYKLVSLDYGEKVARWATIALAIFPTSYFFNSPYTESLFLLLFSVSFFAARKEKWIWAGLFAALATAARPYGFLLALAILVEWCFSNKRYLKHLPVIIIPSVLSGLAYLYLNQHVYGNPFMFKEILAVHWQKSLVSPVEGIFDSWRIAFSGGLTNFVLFVGWAEAISATVAWGLVPLVIKHLKRSWAFFYIASIALFTSTNFILSMPRYLLSVPPLFVLIGMAQKSYTFRLIWRFASVALLFCLAVLFTRGQWAF